jgi:hypothetical protein
MNTMQSLRAVLCYLLQTLSINFIKTELFVLKFGRIGLFKMKDQDFIYNSIKFQVTLIIIFTNKCVTKIFKFSEYANISCLKFTSCYKII